MNNHLLKARIFFRQQQTVDPIFFRRARPSTSHIVGFRQHKVVDFGKDVQSPKVAKPSQSRCRVSMDLILQNSNLFLAVVSLPVESRLAYWTLLIVGVMTVAVGVAAFLDVDPKLVDNLRGPLGKAISTSTSIS
ncbi:MAG: hypothetical protein Q9175_006760 [Cornicularia normoerica]